MKKKDTFFTIDRKIRKACKEAGHKKVYVDYSAYTDDIEEEPIDNLDEIAVKGKVILVGFADDFFGGKKSRSYVSPVLENPTWLQVAVCCNEMIRTTRDTHHVFLETLHKIDRKYPLIKQFGLEIPAGVIPYEFGMGS